MVRCFLVLFLLAAVVACSADIGSQLHRDYEGFYPMPTNTSDLMGWEVSSDGLVCDPALGIKYSYNGPNATTEYPMVMYFTPAGEVAGTGIYLYGDDFKANIISHGYYMPVAHNQYLITASFRAPGSGANAVCSTQPSDLVLGDRVVINQGGALKQSLPLLESEAQAQNWTRGSCFSTMGTHWFYDLASAPVMSWEAANLLPVVPMYFDGKLNAFFWASSVIQQGVLHHNMWEAIPLPNILMCKNFCSSECTFHDTHFTSTLHIYLSDYKEVTCPGGCDIGCCPGPL